MSQYRYSPLLPRPDYIRLLRLMPHKDEAADIQCELFEYSLRDSSRTHLYEALSYVWGKPDEKLPIFIHGHRFDVTVNLRAALSCLRNHSIERILWVDAICIDQANQEEKKHQIRSMATIYAQASRVIVWLGEKADDSDQALEVIRVTADDVLACPSNNEMSQKAIFKLLERPWFRRIWVLQEVGAARRVLIMCGPVEINGYAFCSGLNKLNLSYGGHPGLQGLIHSVTFLIRGAIFRPKYGTGLLGGVSLGELIDMYHTREATERHDKVYALLGMSSDDISAADLLPDYTVPWKTLLQQLVKFILYKEVSVETWDESEIAVIKSKGCILGQVSSVESDSEWYDRQHVKIIFKNASRSLEYEGEWGAQWTLQASAKSIRQGDLVCLLQGVSNPTIIRACKDHSAVIMIAATPLKNKPMEGGYIKWLKLLQSIKTFTRDFLLVWDWENSPEKLQGLEEYKALIGINNWVSEHLKTDGEGHLDKATRVWNVALILGDSGKYTEARKRLQEAIKGYKIAFGIEHPYMLKSEYGLTPLSWAAENGYDGVVHLLLAKNGVDPDLKDSEYGQTPLSWAAERGHEAVVRLLLETGKVDVDAKDKDSRTPLSRAAEKGHEVVVKLLLETGKVDVDWKDKDGWTPLLWATEEGHEAVVELLLKVGAEVNSEYGIYVGKPSMKLVYALVESIANLGVSGCYSL